MNVFDHSSTWKFSAAGKHPVAGDFVKLGENIPLRDEFSALTDAAYAMLTSKANAAAAFSSWRFWSKGPGRDILTCGVVRESSDKMGRPYPFLIVGCGPLKDWETRWDLLPFACENTWVQFEYLATHKFDSVKKLEEDLAAIRPPSDAWPAHAARRRSLNEIGSPLDPYASFLDFDKLSGQAEEQSDKAEFFVSLDRGPCNDKILQVSLWHRLFKAAVKTLPQTLFMGGTPEKAFLAAYNRSLKAADFVQLWSASTPALWKNVIGTEYAMDLSSLGKEPISPDRPAGSDVRYDPAFQEMQDEIDKLTSPSAPGSVNWQKVVRFASDILAHKSKDLMVATYLACALIYTRQYDGLAMGVKVLSDLMTRFWEDLYPAKERMRGRLRSMEWWVEKSDLALKQLPPASVPGEQIAILSDNLDTIEQCMRQHLDNPPSLRAIRECVRSIKVNNDARPPHEEPAKPPAMQPTPVDTLNKSETPEPRMSAVLPKDIQPPQMAQRMLENQLQKIREIAGYHWQQDAANPLVYRINRKTLWCNIEDLPPTIQNRTRIPAPDNQVMKMLFDLRSTGDAEALLKAAEGRLPQYIFWLDLNRFVAEALTRLGAKYARAHRAVCLETAFLLYQLPGLEDLTFADGTPFANPETKNWIKIIDMDAGATIDAVPAAAAAGREEGMNKEITEAQSLIRKGKLLEAMEILQTKLSATVSSREKILWRLAISQLLLDVRQARLALPHLDQIIREIDIYRLEDYDPALALRGLKLAWQGMESQNDETLKAKASDILYRIARIDMAEVIRLGKN